jgi:Tol biopolymer transport system component
MRTLPSVAVGMMALAALAAPAGTGWTRVSVASAGGQPQGDSQDAAVTPNGRFVAFNSTATDLLTAPGNSNSDVFVRDMKAGTTELLSHDGAGAEGDGASDYPSISNSGRWVAFESRASGLGGGNPVYRDVFVADRSAGTITLASERFDGLPIDADSNLSGVSLSGNGRWVVFSSSGTGIVEGVETYGYVQIYMRDLRRGTTTLVSRDRDDPQYAASGSCADPSISANGRFVVFSCNSANLVPGSSNGQMHVYVFDAKTGAMARVTVAGGAVLADNASYGAVVSNNGKAVAFYSYATNLVAGDANGTYDAFLADLKTGEIRRMSDSAGAGGSYSPAISASGRVVVFYSEQSDLVAGDGNGVGDAFRFDGKTGEVSRLTVDSGGVEGNGYSYLYGPSLSSNGKWLAISTAANNLAAPGVSADSIYDVFLKALK